MLPKVNQWGSSNWLADRGAFRELAAHHLELSWIATGVETAQAEHVRRIGCMQAQGHLVRRADAGTPR
jgi:hypothetical protein